MLPNPETYGDWKGWAAALMLQLQSTKEPEPVSLPRYRSTLLPDPATYPACWIYVDDDATPAFSDGSDWLRPDGTAL